MSRPLVVMDIVGLTPSLLGDDTPHLNALIRDGFMAPMQGVFPAVTCSAQSTLLTGLLPRDHGIVANGWYFRDLAEIWLWRQSNHLVQGEKIWHAAHRQDPQFTCAQLFWWYNMYADVDWSVTPRPMYPADGRKLPGLYSQPAGLENELQRTLGEFPLFNFWGPAADIRSSQWIADSARQVFDRHRPRLTLVYLPHLDYNLQRLGPNDPAIAADIRRIDQLAGGLIDHVRGQGAEVLVLSEYGIEEATGVVSVNRVLRESGLLRVRNTLGWELLDAGASDAFAVADHQIAHVYVRDPDQVDRVKALLQRIPGIARVLDEIGKAEFAIDHPRSGELIAIAEPGHWFSYYYWLDDARAPDFASSVDIHRKPGFDPAELFIDPAIRFPRLRILSRILRKKIGFRYLMDVIPTHGDLVRGTHGRQFEDPAQGPLVIASNPEFARDSLHMTGVKELMLQMLD